MALKNNTQGLLTSTYICVHGHIHEAGRGRKVRMGEGGREEMMKWLPLISISVSFGFLRQSPV